MPRAKNDVTRINVYVPDKVLSAYKALAKKRDVPYSELIRAGMLMFIKKELIKEKANGSA